MPQYILHRYSHFLDEIPLELKKIAHLAHVPQRFFYLAQVQINSFIKALDEHFSPQTNSNSYEACCAFGYGFYPIIRTCLESSAAFSSRLDAIRTNPELQIFRESRKNKIKTIIDTANNIVKHPIEDSKRSKVTWYEPGGLDSLGDMQIYEWSTINDNHFEILNIRPTKDLETVFCYLEDIADIYIKSYITTPKRR